MSEPTQKANARKIREQSKIRELLSLKGVSLASIDRDYNLFKGSAANALREPNAPAERAIAAALRTKPHLLWRTRYHASGQRRSPQDYVRVPTMAQRRKEKAA